MKRTLIFLIAILSSLVIVGYPAVAWFFGKQIETTLDDQYNALHDLVPFITLSDRNYDRGVFSSNETVTVTTALTPLATPVRFTLTSKIRHLPFVGMLVLETATVDSELTVNDGFKQDVSEWMGDKNLVAIHTTLHFNGGGNTTVTIPAFNSARLLSDEATLKIGFSKNLASYSMQGNMPKIVFSDKSGNRLQVSGMHFDRDHKRIFPDEPALYSGSDHLAIEQLDASGITAPTLSIGQLAVDRISTVDNDNEFVDDGAKIGMSAVKIADKDYGPAQLNMSFHHLHARTVASLYHAYLDAKEKNSVRAYNYLEVIAATASLNQELLKHDPEFRIDRLSFTRPEGESILSALFKIRDAQPSDFSNPMALLAKFYISVDIKIPEQFISELTQNKFASVSQPGGGFDKELARMVTEGYVSREDGYIKTRFEFHDGKVWLNSKQYVQPVMAMNPTPFAGGPAYNDMPALAKRLNCSACHSINRPLVGPSWMDVSNRYRNATQFESQGRIYPLEEGLMLRISKGGAGHWGHMPMPAIDAMGNRQAEIRELVRFILALAKTDAYSPRTINGEAVSPFNRSAGVTPSFRIGESFDDFIADIKMQGYTSAAIDPHSRTANGEVTSVSLGFTGIRLFFANTGKHELETIRYDAPYSGKVRGIGLGDSLFKLNNMLGSPVKPPWKFADNSVYLYPGESNRYDRFDIAGGVVKTIFVLR
jgi:uncharacterized protein YdgA (DUF945 family)/cytochrome c551/c552